MLQVSANRTLLVDWPFVRFFSVFCHYVIFLLNSGHASASLSALSLTVWNSFEKKPRGPSPLAVIILHTREGFAKWEPLAMH